MATNTSTTMVTFTTLLLVFAQLAPTHMHCQSAPVTELLAHHWLS
jgi:hypothetical protein